MAVQTIVFSKDRALQLQATLESFAMWCTDAHDARIHVVCKTSSPRHARQYNALRRRFPHVVFIAETDFRMQVCSLAAQEPFVLFLVDDNIFYRPFSLQEAVSALTETEDALGFSLRLGMNTTYCHTQYAAQAVPPMEPVAGNVVRFRWQNAEHDFGYPLEVSSSVYHSRHILALLHDIGFTNPNLLEAELSKATGHVEQFEWLLCYRQSVTFCNPLNRVQNIFANRVADKAGIDAETLAEFFDSNRRIDVAAYAAASPDGAHFEMELVTAEHPAADNSMEEFSAQRISAVIPVYNGARFLPDAVESLAAQNDGNLEVIIVNDGSEDDSSGVARQLAGRYPQLNIIVLDKPNGGLASARNAGIEAARGDWILPLDCDDCFEPQFLNRAREIIATEPEVNLVFANMQEFGVKNGQWIPAEYSPATLAERNTFPYASLYRRELWTAAGGYDPSMPWGAEDWSFWLACAPFGLKSRRIAEPLFRYRTHPEGSMYTKMLEHWDEVKACIATLHPTVFPIPAILAAHGTIASMSEQTRQKIDAITQKHPERPMPHLWLGLSMEARNSPAEAMAHYTRALAHAPYCQWQTHFRMGVLNATIGRKAVAARCIDNTLERRPELAQGLKAFTPSPLSKRFPLNVALTSNLAHWKEMQNKNYFDNHFVYLDEKKRLKDFGDDLEWIERRRPLDKTMNVVVLGCGYGRETAMIAPKVQHVFGIDVSQRILSKCERRLRSKGIDNFTGIAADTWKAGIPHGIDFVYCITVFQHLTRDLVEDYLRGLRKKLSPGGTLLCQFAELPNATEDARLEVYEPNVRWTATEIQEVIGRAGLQLLDLESQPMGKGFWHWAYMGAV